MSNDKIYQLRQQAIEPALAAKLWPFINCYKPHDPIETGRELRGYNLERIETESLMELITDQWEAEQE